MHRLRLLPEAHPAVPEGQWERTTGLLETGLEEEEPRIRFGSVGTSASSASATTVIVSARTRTHRQLHGAQYSASVAAPHFSPSPLVTFSGLTSRGMVMLAPAYIYPAHGRPSTSPTPISHVLHLSATVFDAFIDLQKSLSRHNSHPRFSPRPRSTTLGSMVLILGPLQYHPWRRLLVASRRWTGRRCRTVVPSRFYRVWDLGRPWVFAAGPTHPAASSLDAPACSTPPRTCGFALRGFQLSSVPGTDGDDASEDGRLRREIPDDRAAIPLSAARVSVPTSMG
uniref:Uncharacterized protein n=1 Tax=Mycena chlorophos TaxID=658473 RepID=A0ABQ0L984_MYCCL|nr:predicted protein [Mycena chlorophos]